jgi:pimeloyl-ACP methyl ester carboxylesterase
MSMITATDLHVETRGRGPTVLMITGATGDAGHWDAVADHLSDAFTVLTYDRRGNSRSPAPAGWTSTTIAEQADDAAALLEAVGAAPAAVVGNSLGAVIASALVERRPEIVRRVVLHEPPLLGMVPEGAAIAADLETMIGAAVREGGFRLAMERFLASVAGEEVVAGLDPVLRARMLGNAETFFQLEMPALAAHHVDTGRLRATGVPLVCVAGRDNRGTYLHTGTGLLAGELGLDLVEVEGAHVPYFVRPEVFAAELREILLDTST